MKSPRLRKNSPLHQILRLSAPLAFGSGLSQAVPVAIPTTADLGVSENAVDAAGTGALSDSSLPNAITLNTRFTNTNRNEVIVMRFDLTGFNRAAITAASLNLINYSANNATTYRLWGANDGSTGFDATTTTEGSGTDNNWPEETTKFATTPSLEFDALSTTRGNLTTRSTDLGTVAVAAPYLTEGTEIALSTTALKDFLVNHPDNIVTLILRSETVNSGIKRFASKEATTLNSGGTPQAAGTYAPRLVIDLPGQRIPATADADLTETTVAATGNGMNPSINARWVYLGPTDTNNRNDVIGLRFDLTGVDRSSIIGAQVRLTNFRDNTTVTPLHFYGVNDGSTGNNVLTMTPGTATDNNWPESATTFSNMPGIEFDADLATPGIRTDLTVDLGEVVTSAAAGNLNKGTYVSLTSNHLITFLKTHPDDIVTILVVDPNLANGGQKRFASRRATLLDGDTIAQAEGSYAPEINLLLGAAAVAADFRISAFTAGPGAGHLSLTWLSQPGKTYSISYSTTLTDGFSGSISAGILASPGATTTHLFENPLPAADQVFFRVSCP